MVKCPEKQCFIGALNRGAFNYTLYIGDCANIYNTLITQKPTHRVELRSYLFSPKTDVTCSLTWVATKTIMIKFNRIVSCKALATQHNIHVYKSEGESLNDDSLLDI